MTTKTATAESGGKGYTLAFDACAKKMSFCLWEGDELRLRHSSPDGERLTKDYLAEDLPFLLAKEMEKKEVAQKSSQEFSQKFSYGLLRRICFVRGPGSYTGLRAGLSVARGLRLACEGLGLFSVTSFEAGLLAATEGASTAEATWRGYVLSLVESFRGVFYAQAFREGEAWGEARVLGADALRLWVFQLLERGDGVLGLCGGGVERAYAEALGSFPREAFVLAENGNRDAGDAWSFSRPLVRGEQGMYAQGEEALLPVYMSNPV